MRYDWALFDLDGTLTDPGLGITNAVLYAMEQAGMAPWPREALYRFIGPPLLSEFEEAFGASPLQAEALMRDFRVYFEARGIFENRLYAGIPALLERLRAAGLRLALATSKPQDFAVRILEHFGLRAFFDIAVGCDMDEHRRTKKGEVIAAVLEQGICRERAVMVGDRRHDVLGAAENGLPAVGVLYGYGSRRELEESGAAFIAPTVPSVGDILLA